MMGDVKFGIAAALNQPAVLEAKKEANQALIAAKGRQEELFVRMEMAENARLDALLPTPPPALPAGTRGRPAGSPNKRTKETAEYLLNRYGNPIERLQALGGMPLDKFLQEMTDLSKKFKLKMPERIDQVIDLQVRINAAAAPYLMARMPIAVEMETTRRTVLQLGDLDTFEGTYVGSTGFDAADYVKSDINQSLIESEADKSDGEKS